MKAKGELLYRKDAPGTLVGATVDFASMGFRVGDLISFGKGYRWYQRLWAWLRRKPLSPQNPTLGTHRIVKVTKTTITFDKAEP